MPREYGKVGRVGCSRNEFHDKNLVFKDDRLTEEALSQKQRMKPNYMDASSDNVEKKLPRSFSWFSQKHSLKEQKGYRGDLLSNNDERQGEYEEGVKTWELGEMIADQTVH